jgi:hypothetical protein
MSHTYTPTASTGSVTGALSSTLPDDATDAVAVASVNTPFGKIMDVLESVRQVITGGLAQVVTLLATRSSNSTGAGQALAQGAIYGDSTIRGWAYITVSGGVMTLQRGVNIGSMTYTSTGIMSVGLQTTNANVAIGAILPVNTSSTPIIPIAGLTAPGVGGFGIRFYTTANALVDPPGFFILFVGG